MTVAREFDGSTLGRADRPGRKQGVPEATLTAIREKHSRGLPPEDAQIVDFTRDLIHKNRVSAAAAKALQERFGNFSLSN